jgi:hypothetical protein
MPRAIRRSCHAAGIAPNGEFHIPRRLISRRTANFAAEEPMPAQRMTITGLLWYRPVNRSGVQDYVDPTQDIGALNALLDQV